MYVCLYVCMRGGKDLQSSTDPMYNNTNMCIKSMIEWKKDEVEYLCLIKSHQ
jgi:hypothetical protein